MLVDGLERKPIGRPGLTLALDVASRAALEFFLSLKARSSLAVALALSRAVLPKDVLWFAT